MVRSVDSLLRGAEEFGADENLQRLKLKRGSENRQELFFRGPQTKLYN